MQKKPTLLDGYIRLQSHDNTWLISAPIAGVLSEVSRVRRPGNFPARVSAESTSNISPNCLEQNP